MTDTDISAKAASRGGTKLLALLYLHVAASCVSLAYVSYYYGGYHLLKYQSGELLPALLITAPLAALAFVFARVPFSFGFMLGFGFYSLILGYLFLARFSELAYDHTIPIVSAAVSLAAFLVPALLITTPIKRRLLLSQVGLERLLLVILAVSLVVVIVGASINFRLVGMSDIYAFREQITFPAPLRYAIGNLTNALLPFAFACYVAQGKPLRALAALVLLGLFYPVTLTKVTLLSPIWLLFLWWLARSFETRTAVVLSALLPILAGDLLLPLVASETLSYQHFISYFGTVNFRTFAVPSIALDLYSDFFSKHDLTHFCQSSFAKPFMACPYTEPLQIVMANNYPLGLVNASLFANEGVASLGFMGAPLSALVCGLIVGFVNRLSNDLPPRFILVSAGALAQIMMNVPFLTSLLSNGAALLFLLWFVMPREMFAAADAAGGSVRM